MMSPEIAERAVSDCKTHSTMRADPDLKRVNRIRSGNSGMKISCGSIDGILGFLVAQGNSTVEILGDTR